MDIGFFVKSFFIISWYNLVIFLFSQVDVMHYAEFWMWNQCCLPGIYHNWLWCIFFLYTFRGGILLAFCFFSVLPFIGYQYELWSFHRILSSLIHIISFKSYPFSMVCFNLSYLFYSDLPNVLLNLSIFGLL
jgi:hypothetical protein